VLWVDRFGNVQLAARPSDAARAGLDGPGRVVDIAAWQPPSTTRRRGRTITSFSDLGDTAAVELGHADEAAEPEVGLMVDANGYLALVCHRHSAATVLGVRARDMVTVSQVRAETENQAR
jgi:hypothetical protein